MKSTPDLNDIFAEFATAIPYTDDDGNLLISVYLGSMPWPSGKFYTEWANGNVDEEEVREDEMWFSELEAKLEKIGAWLEAGEGDSCDLYVVKEANR